MIQSDVIYAAYNRCDLNNYWAGTPYEIYYTVGAKTKGAVGEAIVRCFLESHGKTVKYRKNPGHDMIVEGIKTEVKFSLASKRNTSCEFTFNHIGIEKDWERIIFCGINGDLEEKICWFSKDELINILNNTEIFRIQEGDDDFFSMGKKTAELLNRGHSMEEW